jgi:large subunit ribosomal protein L3
MNQQMGLIGRKVGMTQLFTDDGTVVPVTVIEAGPCTVLQVKAEDGADSYNAVQLGFGTKKDKGTTRATRGHAAKANAKAAVFTHEIRLGKAEAATYTPGQVVGVAEVFQPGALVDVIATSKGRGFAGVFKKFHFAGFERSHGTHEYFRHGGSIGTRLTPGMTMRGKKMPGQLGNAQVTVQNIEVVKIDGDRGLIYIRGGVPGPNGGFVTVRKAVKNK